MGKKLNLFYLIIPLIFITIIPGQINAARYMENLDRGVVAVWMGSNRVWVSWRMLGTDPTSIGFNVYRNGVKINSSVITNVTYYIDTAGSQTASYYIRPVINGVEQAASKTVTPWANFYRRISLRVPSGGTTPDGVSYTYSPNDCSVGDLDGDGEYEIVLKWDPSNSKDNSQSGYTGNVYLDAYKLDGTFMWRIDLGINIRAGAHYTQFMVYDLDSDGKAEIACKTAPGTRDGTGTYLRTGPAASDNDSADYRNSSGYILTGPEYLTVFRGTNGAEIVTVNYVPPRGNVSDWGDNYGNRVDRFLACIAYLDGVHPSLVMQRGYYTRMVLAAWDFNGSSLTQRWVFDSNNGYSSYAGQGNHNLSVGDVDGDGRDEIIQGACAINDNGTGMYVTRLGHGDAMHLGDLNPDRPGLEVWEVHESTSASYGYEMHDARTGQIIWGTYTGTDNGRGLAADIDSRYRGYEMWSASGTGVYSCTGTQISTSKPTINFRIYWDGDLLDEILDGTVIDKWNGNGTTRLLTGYNYESAAAINGTKNTPCLSADILGDWREELILRTSDNTALVIFTTTTETNFRMYTLMHDPQYRLSIAWQNVAYNQPPHLGFYLYDGNPPTPDIILVGAGTPTPAITATRTPTATSTRTYTVTVTRTNTVQPTNTWTWTSTRTATPTNTLTATGTSTRTNTAQSTNTWTRTRTATPTYSITATATRTNSPSPSATSTASRTSTASITVQPTNTFTGTRTMTPTWTRTVTGTGTATRTNTPTSTATVSYTLTNTPYYSATHTATGTRTVTSTYTQTATGTNTPVTTNTWTVIATRTSTLTFTFTRTNTFSPSATASPSDTLTRTATWTATRTNTATGTSTTIATSTFTSTRTVTFIFTTTPTFTYTRTATGTNSPSPSASATATADRSPSFTITITVTMSRTTTPSWTQTATVTSSQVASLTFTSTRTNTSTSTPTRTFTNSQVPSVTSTATMTVTITVTSLQVASFTSTATRTITITVTSSQVESLTSTSTRTMTQTSTYTRTSTLTPMFSQTPSASATATADKTITWTSTPQPTNTHTPTATKTPIDNRQLAIDNIVIYSNPYKQGDIKIGFNITQDMKVIKVRIYTSGYRLIKQITLEGEYKAGENIINIDSRYLNKLANGVYYVILIGKNRDGIEVRGKPVELVVLK